MEETGAADIPSFLDKPSYKEKTIQIENTFRRIARTVKAEPMPKYLLLDVHLSFTKRNEFLPPLNFSNYDELVSSRTSPVKIITLVDDNFHVWDTIRRREEEGSFSNTKLRLRELAAWRSVELLQAETLAKHFTDEYRHTQNFEVAVRHPKYVLHSLVFRKNPVCGYLSFPITRVRESAECLAEINRYRIQMHELAARVGFVAFDPVTIDELLPALELKKVKKEETDPLPRIVEVDTSRRWPLGIEGYGTKVESKIIIPGDEIQEVTRDVYNNIRARDFKLIDTSILTAVYRPYFIERSVGANAEIDYSVNESKKVLVYHSSKDKKESGSPFDAAVAVYDQVDNLYRTAEIFMAGKVKRAES